MALFGRRKPTATDTRGWIPVEITIRQARRPVARDGGGGDFLSDLVDIATDRSDPYSFTLEVREPGKPPSIIEHQENVPHRVTNAGIGRGEQKIPDGVEITGWVDPADPTRVSIDWSGYNKTAESQASVADAAQDEQDLLYARHMIPKMKPAQLAQMRANAEFVAMTHAPLVRDGQLPREQFELEAQMNLRRTLLSQESYDAAVAIIEGRA